MRRQSRKYKDVVELWETVPTPDGYGGNTVADTKISDCFANVKTLSANQITDLGLRDNAMTVEIYLRLRSDVTYSSSNTFFKIKGVNFTINSIENMDIDGIYAKIIASTSDGELQAYNPVDTFDLTFDNNFR